jgi:WD40-like Beta Propeller Repeat
MTDDTIFERRLTDALARYADLAPGMDDEVIAREAVGVGGRGRFRWLAALQGFALGPAASRGVRTAYVIALLALLLAALIVAAVVGGFFRSEALPPVGGNGLIAYSFGGNNHEPVAAIALAADGSDVHPIDAGRCPTYSSDGGVLAWLVYEGSAAYLVSAAPDGSRAQRAALVDPVEQTVPYALSPAGSRVAWVKPGQPRAGSASPDASPPAPDSVAGLWVARRDGSAAVRVVAASTVAGESYVAPVWSPDGRLIAFGVATRDAASGASARVAIDVVGVDGTGRRRLTTRSGHAEDALAWSPDGRHLAYAGADLGDRSIDLYIVGVDGTGESRVTDTPLIEHDVAWSADGAFLGFETSTEGAPDRLTTLRMDGAAGVGQPMLGPESDWFVWSPDGRQLLWQELETVAPETFRTTLHSIDPEMRGPPTTLQVVDGLIVCTPSWQRLAP